MRVVFLGSPAAVLGPLQFLASPESQVSLVAVVSQPAKPAGRGGSLQDPPVADFAKSRKIALFQPDRASDSNFLRALAELKPDLMMTAAYGQILTEQFLEIPRRGTINIHPSLLPLYRGATPVPAALLAGDRTTGVTILFTVKKLDAGHIICQRETAIQPGETAGALTTRLFDLSIDALPDAFHSLADPNFCGEPQDETRVTHCRKIHKDDGCIDWSLSATDIRNRFCAFHPWPGTYTFLGGRRLAVEELDVATPAQSLALPRGHVRFSKQARALIIGTGNGDIAISRLRPAGGKSQDAGSFWNGLKAKENLIVDANP